MAPTLVNTEVFSWPDVTPTSTKVKIVATDGLFNPLLAAVYDGMKELGIDVKVVGHHNASSRYDLDDEESIFVISVVWAGGPFPKKYIGYNWEQLTAHDSLEHDPENFPGIVGKFPGIIDNFRGAIEVWDYSEENVKMFKKYGINARVVLPGYHHSWHSFRHPANDWSQQYNKKHTLAFFGQNSYMRPAWLDQIKKEFGDKFSHLSTPEAYSAKAIVNIHIFPNGTALEIHRIMQCVTRDVIVLSQRSDDPSLDNLYGPMVDFWDTMDDLKELVDSVDNLSHVEYQQISMQRLRYFQSLPRFAENLKKVDTILLKRKPSAARKMLYMGFDD